ncbi:MAG: MarR family winged helix-turn-helix transcriptional regulator [Caulobacteraceae bacterium]
MPDHDNLDAMGLDALPSVRLVRLAELFGRSAAAVFERNFGLNTTELRIIVRLSNADAVTVNELARQLVTDKGWVSRSLKALEHRHLVRRSPHPTDTRATLVYLTGAGEELQRQIFPLAKAHDERLLSGVDRGEVERLLDELGQRVEAVLLDNQR